MPSRTKSKGSKGTNKKGKSNAKNKNNGKKSINSTTAKILETAEQKYESDEEQDDHFKSEHYLRLNRTISKAKFTAIDCISPTEIIPLKRKAITNPVNKNLKQETLDKLRREKYQQWLIELKSGFNLLFYGVGSKKLILEDFAKLYCCQDPNGIVIRINGFFEDVTIRDVLDSLHKVIIDKDKKRRAKKNAIKTDKDITQRAMNIVSYLEEAHGDNLEYKYYYMLVHNITGKVLRKSKVQRIFSILANCSRIHLIGSIDHIHSLLLWNKSELSLFHWIHHEITTYKHYFEEMEFEKDETIKVANNGRDNGLEHIMQSLTPGHRDIIQILAMHQNEEGQGTGLAHDDWYAHCEMNMLVHNTLKFEQYITEFIDHNVIIKDTSRGNIIYTIPYHKDIIQRHLIDYDLD